ncbi:MAG: NAD(P) transhydrogenase subunit alpha [Deltaproteobacteria bacterium]|nr:NAD(P) transhydrogenase subunit alpha [Deltaproteobacteria bacterium]
MAIHVGVITEIAADERRIAMTPDIAGRLATLGGRVFVEAGAGRGAFFDDAAFQHRSAIITDRQTVLTESAILWTVQPPAADVIAAMRPNSMVMGLMLPHQSPDRVRQLCAQHLTAFGMELIPRVTRAQTMDVLSSQATIAGYKATLLAAQLSGVFFPMLTTAAGTIRPAKVLILGAGVAGLQASATARRLGALVEAYDVRRAAKEEVESLGARFIGLPIDAATTGGYARALTAEERAQEEQVVAEHVAKADVVITTAQIPGRPAPRLIDRTTVEQMRPGAVIVDLAAESGGNCACTTAGSVTLHHGVTIAGPRNIASTLPGQASEMYAKNCLNFYCLLTREGTSLDPDWNDEIIAGALLVRDGTIRHEPTREQMEGAPQ